MHDGGLGADWFENDPVGAGGGGSKRLASLLRDAQASVEFRQRREQNVPEVGYPDVLPITVRAEEIVDKSNQV